MYLDAKEYFVVGVCFISKQERIRGLKNQLFVHFVCGLVCVAIISTNCKYQLWCVECVSRSNDYCFKPIYTTYIPQYCVDHCTEHSVISSSCIWYSFFPFLFEDHFCFHEWGKNICLGHPTVCLTLHVQDDTFFLSIRYVLLWLTRCHIYCLLFCVKSLLQCAFFWDAIIYWDTTNFSQICWLHIIRYGYFSSSSTIIFIQVELHLTESAWDLSATFQPCPLHALVTSVLTNKKWEGLVYIRF